MMTHYTMRAEPGQRDRVMKESGSHPRCLAGAGGHAPAP
jgi:hypothetical protein